MDMENQSLKTIALYARLYPLFVILLLPEITYSVLFAVWFLVESINHSGLGRTMETHVGLGIIFMIIVYGMFFVIGLAALLFSIWRIIRSFKVSKGLLNFSEQDRKSLIFANSIYTVFIIAALMFTNFCNLPGRSEVYSHSTTQTCKESTGRNVTKALDILILPYFVSSLFFFYRRRTRKLFSEKATPISHDEK
jgi:hypothetical protein